MDQKMQSGKPNQFSGSRLLWFLAAWLLISGVASVFYQPEVKKVSYTKFKTNLTEGNVKTIRVKGDVIRGEFKTKIETGSGRHKKEVSYFKTVLPSFGDRDLMDLIEKKNVTIFTEKDERSWISTLLISLLPWILIIGFFIYSSRQIQQRMGGGQGVFGFGKSRAKLYDRADSDVTFDNVAGLSNAKQELFEVVDFLKDPSKFARLGGKPPKGILLAGAPGTGKTLLARAVSGEADVPFYSISGSEFIEMFVGVGASRVRDMFQRAKKEAPVIIFIDELDSIGRFRGAGLGGGHDEREQTLNQILSEMDGFSPNDSVIVLAATNRPDILDPALVRPGRFDRKVMLELPDKQARESILNIHADPVPMSENVDLSVIAGVTAGLSGADLENIVNEAAIIAGRRDHEQVDTKDMDEAVDKIRMGPERDQFISDDEKRMIAYHEAGHALTAKNLDKTDPLKKATIIPHGQALGMTEQIPEKDRHTYTKQYLLNRIAIFMGGRVAEQMVFNDVSSGAANDLKNATETARRMVCQWGMSEKLGPVNFSQGENHPFLGKEMTEPKKHSEDTARMIDTEIQAIIRDMEEICKAILDKHRNALNAVAETLIEHETLDDDDIEKIIEEKAE